MYRTVLKLLSRSRISSVSAGIGFDTRASMMIGVEDPTGSGKVAINPKIARGVRAQCVQVGSLFLNNRRFSTSILTPDSGDFPSHLLKSKQAVISSDHTQGLCQDLVIPMTNFLFEDKGLMVLAGDVFGVPIRKDIVHRVVRWKLAMRQQGTHSNKTISEVSGNGRKPYPQKGTGRARHGTLWGPQFRGGATMHSPKPRSHAFKLNKKVRRLGLKIALSARAAEGKLLVFDDLKMPTHKTKNVINW
ncbi:Large ribosomal subunit protein uL4-like protein [Drosera capensis]